MMIVSKFLLYVGTAFIFLSAAAYFIDTYSMVDRGYEQVTELQKDQAVIEKLKIPKEPVVDGGEIIQQLYLLYGQESLQVEIDGHIFSANEDITEISFSSHIDSNTHYHVDYKRNSEGKLIKIIYQREV
jgi:hypothetical protein